MVQTNRPETTADTIIIGAGPAGLYASFVLGLQELKSHIVDALPSIGGQCIQLFADKTIFDIPAVRSCLGRELPQLLLQQARPFQPQLHLKKLVTDLTSNHETSPTFTITLDNGSRLTARSVVIATGTGAFLPKKNLLSHSADLENRQIFYHPPALSDDPTLFAGKHIIVSGDLETTLQTANHLATQKEHLPASVTLIHRRDKFRAEDSTIEQTQKLRDTGRLHFIAGQLEELHLDEECQQLTKISIKQSADQTMIRQKTDLLFILHGLAPQVSNFNDWGLEMQGKQLWVDTATFQTNIPGIFAVGDAITYPGKRQLIASAFHEASVASYGLARFLQGGQSVPQLYTTSNTKLQAILGADRENQQT